MNLIGNSVKFTDEGKIEVIIKEKRDVVECCVSDTGRGVEETDLGTVFDRFHQVGKVMRAGEKGSGLGLTICKGIIKLHKGKIWIESKVNVGSKFFFTIPKLTSSEIIEQNIEMGIKDAKQSFMKMNLLLIKIDNYSTLESTYGLDIVEEFSGKILKKIENDLTPNDFLFKKCKDEFVLFSEVTTQNMIMLVKKIRAAIENQGEHYDESLSVDLSTGVAGYPNDGKTSQLLLNSARKKMVNYKY